MNVAIAPTDPDLQAFLSELGGGIRDCERAGVEEFKLGIDLAVARRLFVELNRLKSADFSRRETATLLIAAIDSLELRDVAVRVSQFSISRAPSLEMLSRFDAGTDEQVLTVRPRA